ncbi:cold-responsive protein kinase 1-like isoform X2 [Macadamia integrifolia]|uniref:cold-responsive protein kinase 1-like isoform X2 n=1 Tax=Macadamia integrifolia TaxID=60698 RepID=UPI001C4FDB78|nr:cold-responsive protein kinase 1-like isoform X2 [Macadamia integrifolia]
MQSKIEVLLMVQLTISVILWSDPVLSDPQTKFLNSRCSPYNSTNPSAFFASLNATFPDLRNQLAGSNNVRFATSQHGRSSPLYGMAQCRDYLSTADCLACFDTAVIRIRNCSMADGALIIFDGCFLRYKSNYFFEQTISPGNTAICGTKNATDENDFGITAKTLLTNIVTVTPRIQGYFAAVKENTTSSGNGSVYAVAQCVHTVSESGCRDCLSVAHQNIHICVPVSDGRAVDAGCFIRYSATAFFANNQTTDIMPFLITKVDILGATELRGPVSFAYRDLEKATGDFSQENKLGEGGFGVVYKGVLKNGKTVAVKKLTIGQSSRAKADFASEVKLISNVRHRNVARLLGCCSKGPELLLVYEYMANSSLDKLLFGEKRGTLNWKQRFNIIVGMARGLAYLHEEFHVCIIHRDIKSSNILLDDDFQPKIADFGLARFRPGDRSHLSTGFAGTLGYTSPEYAIHGQLSEKVDTYSYGVVVLEIISGRKSNDLKLEPETQYLLEGAWKLYEDDKLIDLVDKSLSPNEYEPNEVKKIIEIALQCTQSSVASRPTMSQVVVMLLSKGGQPEVRPTRPLFIDATSRVRGDKSTSTWSSASNATASTTQVSGR